MFTIRRNLRFVNGHRLRDVHVGYNLYNCGLQSFFTGNFQPSCGITFHYKLDLVTISMTLLYIKILGICIWGLILGLALDYFFASYRKLTEVSCKCDPKFLRGCMITRSGSDSDSVSVDESDSELP